MSIDMEFIEIMEKIVGGLLLAMIPTSFYMSFNSILKKLNFKNNWIRWCTAVCLTVVLLLVLLSIARSRNQSAITELLYPFLVFGPPAYLIVNFIWQTKKKISEYKAGVIVSDDPNECGKLRTKINQKKFMIYAAIVSLIVFMMFVAVVILHAIAVAGI